MSRARRAAQRGFTLIELMISLLIASLLVILILSVFSRLSFAYREQQHLGTLQKTLAAARQVMEHDAKQAGYAMAQGFRIAADGADAGAVKHSPLVVVNSASGPDEVGFYYADASAQAVVTTSGPATTLSVDDATGFAANDLVVLSTADLTTATNPVSPTTDAKLTTFDACVVQIQQVSATSVTFAQNGSWGRANNDHCINALANTTMMYKFVAHYWRIDPAREDEGVLQLAENGNLIASDGWKDQAYGFTDIQVATYFYDGDGTDTLDPDDDGARDWVSDGAQDTLTAPIPIANSFTAPLVVTMSLVARTQRDVEGIYTAATPELVGTPGDLDHNMIGDHASVPLPSTSDPRLAGKRIYRFITFQADLRNLGIGR
ncbi:MAG: prepilin-type N-terminal cleavage/methylation domain-containing protein [Kofleriaceae bacterium]|nr:prepilin-type N-terminal cleavage/methylation domain-containing protein [Kofleriaceae bacterium]